MAILDKLLNVQTALKAPRNQRNSFGNYNYRSCEDILEAVKPLLSEEKLTLTLSDTLKNVGDRYYIKATATLTDGTDTVSVSAYAREEETKKGMDGSQITGSASSYARKYALNGLFLIDDTKDADTDEHHNQTIGNTVVKYPKHKGVENQGELPSGMATDKQKAFIFKLLAQRGIDPDQMENYVLSDYDINLKSMTMANAKYLIDQLKVD